MGNVSHSNYFNTINLGILFIIKKSRMYCKTSKTCKCKCFHKTCKCGCLLDRKVCNRLQK